MLNEVIILSAHYNYDKPSQGVHQFIEVFSTRANVDVFLAKWPRTIVDSITIHPIDPDCGDVAYMSVSYPVTMPAH